MENNTKIEFSEDQLEALKRMEDFVYDNNIFLTLRGYAGTGKSFIMKEFVQYLDSIDKPFVLCAPTHKAKLVLEEATGYDAITVHKLLSMSPNIEIFELDYRDLKFMSKGFSQVPIGGLIIIDEASMISSSLYKLLQDVCRVLNTKILFVGDSAQIQPVNEGDISPVFKCENIVTLINIHRQNRENGLLNLLTTLRTTPKRAFQGIDAQEGSLVVYDNAKDFMVQSIPFLKKMIKEQNVREVKLMAYTNERVRGLNECARRVMWGEKEKNLFNKNEILTGYDNFEYNKQQFYNSLDYVVTSDPILTERKIPNFIKLPGFEVQLYDTIYKTVMTTFVLHPETNKDYINTLCQTIERLRMDAISAKNSGNKTYSSLLWRKYFQIVNSFATFEHLFWDNRVIKRKTFDYGYASSIHKCQGSSLNTVFVDMKNVMSCRNINEIRQLQYVSLSRTRTDAYILQ